jgi:hypothetical protein
MKNNKGSLYFRADGKPRIHLENLDSAQNYFFLREAEQILSEQFMVLYAELKSRKFIPTDGSIDPGASSVTARQWDKVGTAQAIADHAADVPLVNVFGSEGTQRMQDYGAGYSFTIPEIQAAARLSRPLERDRAEACRRTIEQKIDSVLATGDSAFGLTGFLNLTGTDTYTTPTGSGGLTTWATKTPDEILADMNGMIQQVIVNTKEVESPTMLLLPPSQLQLISTKARSAVSDTTILNFFKGNRPNVMVDSWTKLSGAGASGVDRAVAFEPSKTKVRALMAIEFEQAQPQLRNWAYVINARARTGGVVTSYPKSIIYADGF